jgi:hypothetical protein
VAATEQDFDDLVESGNTVAYLGPRWSRCLQDLLPVWLARVISGSYLVGWIFGQDATANSWRVMKSGNDLLVQQYSGGAWTTRNTFSASTGLALSAAQLTSGSIADARVPASAVTQHEDSLDHDALQGFVADEHVAHSGVSIVAGTGLSGGGTIAASRTIDLEDTGVTAQDYVLGNGWVASVDAQGRVTAMNQKLLYATITGANQDVTSGSGETDVTSLTGRSLPDTTSVATSSKRFLVELTLPLTFTVGGGDATIKVYVGPTGAKADGASYLVLNRAVTLDSSGDFDEIVAVFEVAPANDADIKIGVSVQASSNTVRVQGNASTAGRYGSLRVTRCA